MVTRAAKQAGLDLLLARSAATEWDTTGRVAGSVDLPLCEEGRRAFLDRLRAFTTEHGPLDLAAILASPDEASRETARLIAEHSGLERDAARVRHPSRLADPDLGLWEGLLDADLQDRSPTIYKRWKDDPTSVSAPDGESIHDARARILAELAKGLDRALERRHRRVALVLRPWAYGIVRAHLRGDPGDTIAEHAKDAPCLEWCRMNREAIKTLRQTNQPARTGAA